MAKTIDSVAFQIFNEIGIIAQLSRTVMESHFPAGVTQPHFSVLNHLVRVGDGQTPLALASAFQVPKATMTHTLAGLERRGWIRLAPNPEDGRSKLVWITAAGRRFRIEAVEALAPSLADLSPILPPDRADTLLASLVDLRHHLDRNRPR